MVAKKTASKKKGTIDNRALGSMGLVTSFSINASPVATTTQGNSSSNNSNCNNGSNSGPFGGIASETMPKLADQAKTIMLHGHDATGTAPPELKFKIESIGVQPEEDDDLDTCPARTRANWPRQLIPWWQPSHPKDKPPYSYATLIAYAILKSQDGRLLLSDIYRWISDTYPYYTFGQGGWQNSIRHNLSLNKKWFLKVDRRPTQANPGKGCYWTLVPGIEQMFIDNITEAGGHSRTHHDMGLTAELSMGHRNNLTRNACAPSLPLPAPTTSTFSHTNNMKIIRPEDYQGNHSSAGTAAASAAAASAAAAAAASAAASASAATAANASSTKPPAMCPMYTTFRMQHQPKRKGNDADLSRVAPSKKRAKIDAPDKDKKHMDDAASDCDSGVDVSNEHVDGKKATVATTDDTNGYYSVLDHYLDMLPMPSEQNDATSGFLDANALAPLPLDVDPIFGYPTLDFYSSNGFYYDDAHVHQPVSYPTVLTSGFDPVQAVPTTVPNDTMYIDPASTLVHAFAQPVMDPSAAEFIDPDAVNAFKTQPLVIQLNQMPLPDANVPLVAAPKEEDQYLTFEDDHPCMELDPETTTNALDPSFVLSLGGIHPSSFGELMPV